MKEKISKQRIDEFKDKMNNFNYLRQSRVSHFQGIYIAFLVAAVVLFVELIAGQDIFLKIILIIGLVILAEMIYRKALVQTQKPVFVCENLAGTIEKGPHVVKAKDGQEYAIFSLSDVQEKGVKHGK